MKILSIDFPITQTGKNFTKDLFICPKIYDQQRKDAFYKRFKNGVEGVIVDGCLNDDDIASYDNITAGVQKYLEDDKFSLVMQCNERLNKTLIIFIAV